jgi:HSP20 family molecular chaperone IbpA
MEPNGKTTQVAVRRQLFPELSDLRETIRAMFDARWPFTLAPRLPFEPQPAVDVFERDGKVVVKAEMPGIRADKVEVTISDHELRISGERKEEQEVSEENFYRSERTYGRIYRGLTLPEGCDTTDVTATAKDGVVEIVIPKKVTAQGKKIAVKAS